MGPDREGLVCRGHRIDCMTKPPRTMLIVANNAPNGLPLDLFEVWLDQRHHNQLQSRAVTDNGAANQILRRITPVMLKKALSGVTLRASDIMGGTK